ncbi:MAG: hypothetical protein KDI00_04380 [Pseudomonadales bacterium]|nr:hypothetical protein [Pseudomonadales bacterium]
MTPKANALFNAHQQHLLAQFAPEQVEATLNQEINAFLDWSQTQPINAVVKLADIQSIAQRYILQQAVSTGLHQQISHLIKAAINSPLNDKTYIHQLIEHKDYLAIVDKIASHEQLRKDLIHTAVGNPVYAKLLSDIVYQALNDYLVNENPLAKKVPGMSSLMKMGKGIMESTGGNAAIESALKSYLHKNTQKIVDISEKILLKTLDAKQIHHVADQLWHKIKGAPLSIGKQYIADSDIDFAINEGLKVWNHFRQTTYAQEMLNELIAAWFNTFADRDGVSLLADLNISREQLVTEILVFAQPVIAQMLASGFIQQRIDVQLKAFYDSPVVAELLG